MLRPIPTQHYLSQMRVGGYTDADLLQGTNIDVLSLNDPAYLISLDDHQRFIENMIYLSGDQGIGLDVGLNNEVAHYGILAYSGLSCHTIREGLHEVWSKYGRAFGIMTRLRIANTKEISNVEILSPRLSEEVYRFNIEEALCVLLNIGGTVTGVAPPFKHLQLAFSEPAYGQRYRDLFRCPVDFDSVKTCISIEQPWLDLPLKTSDNELNRICRQHLEQVFKLTEASDSVVEKLRHLLMSSIDNMPSLEGAASELGVSARTLARQLQREECNYRQVMQNLREELVKKWLDSSDMSSKEISFRLGFKDVGTFRRAFKSWTGKTISEYCNK